MPRLDDIAITIEITLISIVEGLVLDALGKDAVQVFGQGNALLYVPFVLTGLFFIFIFWSQSILHAVSFIRWPVQLGHMFLYFSVAFVQVIAYGNIANPVQWFLWWSVCAALALVVYLIDFRLIRNAKLSVGALPGGESFMKSVEERHRYELGAFAFGSGFFNVALFAIFYTHPAYAANQDIVFAAGAVQLLFICWALADSMRNFSSRSRRIADLFQ